MRYLEETNLDFVGHPLVSEIDDQLAGWKEAASKG
ncbi:MAG: hypothetical protein ACI9HK_003062 [Pirellulaceae bacterium]|jgi:hypothetical protein